MMKTQDKMVKTQPSILPYSPIQTGLVFKTTSEFQLFLTTSVILCINSDWTRFLRLLQSL